MEFPGAFYHVLARGNRRETIFHDEEDRRFFLSTLSEACERTGWRVHAWVLMGNHYQAILLDGEDGYQTLADYIHLNPVRARLIQPKQGQSVVDYPWSSVAGGNDAGLPEVAAGEVARRGAGGTLVGGGAQ